jgi:hypothetical protein
MQPKKILFGAPGVSATLFVHTLALFDATTQKILNSTATQYQKDTFIKQLSVTMSQMPPLHWGFLANTDAESCLGPAQGNPTLGSESILELVNGYLYQTREEFEAIGNQFKVHHSPPPI